MTGPILKIEPQVLRADAASGRLTSPAACRTVFVEA